MEKQISLCRALEHLESSGSKIIKIGPNVRKLCGARKVYTSKILKLEDQILRFLTFWGVLVLYLLEGFELCGSIFELKISRNFL